MIGNDDCGQMSAWYIFSTLGFYPVNPSNASYVIGKPQAKNIIVQLGNGKLLKIKNDGSKSVLFNNQPVNGYTLPHTEISAGGVLNF